MALECLQRHRALDSLNDAYDERRQCHVGADAKWKDQSLSPNAREARHYAITLPDKGR